MGVGDPHLLAVEAVAAVDLVGPAPQRGDIGPRTWLGHRDRRRSTGHDGAEDLLLEVLGGPTQIDVGDDERDRVAADRNLVVGQLLDEQAGIVEPATRAAVLLGDGQSEESEIGELARDLLAVVGLAAVGQLQPPLPGAALPGGELTDGGDQALLFFGQLQAHDATVLSHRGWRGGSPPRTWCAGPCPREARSPDRRRRLRRRRHQGRRLPAADRGRRRRPARR